MRLSACQSYFPDSFHTYFILACFTAPYWFLKHHVGVRMKGPLLNTGICTVIRLLCLSAAVVKEIPLLIMWFIINWIISRDFKWDSWHFTCFFLTLLLCSFSVLSNSFISICLTFLLPGFYFPCCFPYLMLTALSGFVCRNQRIWDSGAWYRRRRCLSDSPCGTLAVPYHVLLIPSL